MGQADTIRAMLAQRPLLHVSDLLDAGVSRSSLRDALARGDVARPGWGLVCSVDDEFADGMADAVACVMTGGIICGLSAAVRQNLVLDGGEGYEMLVPAGSAGKAPTTFPCKLRRYTQPLAGTLGVVTNRAFGVDVRITDRARTVVDLYRFGARDQNVLEAVHAYLREGGNGNELQGICMRLSPSTWTAIQRDVSNVELARARGGFGGSGDDASDCEQGDDHGGGPAFLR